MAKVLYIDDIHLATTRSRPPRLLVTVQGRVTSTGWSGGRLEPWVYIVPPGDGLQDLDFVATPPSGPAGQALMPITGGTSFWLPEWCKGVRVHASANCMESLVPGREPLHLLGATEEGDPGDSWPWQDPDSWPWLIAPEHAETLQRLASTGSAATAECKVSDLIGRPARIIRDGDPTDMMYLPERVTVVLARDKSVIVDVRFG
ncbi:hypothetical protein [Paucibacter sp. DJ2R-2]|uniref:hypothetical protein n=1 Tax=Paucibacter sp. DJ2R-2 TaxID=2893558 RepID=UPI0021E4B7CE|nr:hypothetical protein [Paucibacter sp. DJ2R-2]MCV2419932.1 hypothetical protein [Paucibacter sp. DJ4R-1]MCV2437141.1 hypothetical protein [Paucibacter sp. DJ2R-2]